MSYLNYQINVTGVKPKTVNRSAHTWFWEKNTCRVTEKNGVVTATIKGDYNETTVKKWAKHLAKRKGATAVAVKARA